METTVAEEEEEEEEKEVEEEEEEAEKAVANLKKRPKKMTCQAIEGLFIFSHINLKIRGLKTCKSDGVIRLVCLSPTLKSYSISVRILLFLYTHLIS